MPSERSSTRAVALTVTLIVVLATGCGLFVAIGVREAADSAPQAIDGIESDSLNRENPPPRDVSDVECVTNERGRMEARMRITNHSSRRSNYTIAIAFESLDGGRQLETGFVVVTHLEAEQSTVETAATLAEPPAGGFGCRVVEVDRHAA